jgi:hypothetical protein
LWQSKTKLFNDVPDGPRYRPRLSRIRYVFAATEKNFLPATFSPHFSHVANQTHFRAIAYLSDRGGQPAGGGGLRKKMLNDGIDSSARLCVVLFGLEAEASVVGTIRFRTTSENSKTGVIGEVRCVPRRVV